MNRIIKNYLICIFHLFLFASCNIFSSIDQPTSNTQYLEKARSCFDQGDLKSALTYYGKVSGSDADKAFAETIFATLSANNLTTEAFLNSVQDKNASGPNIINNFAQILHSTSGENLRLTLLNLYQKSQSISSSKLKNLCFLITSLVLLSELFSEIILGSDILQQSDFIAFPSSCLNLANNNTNAYTDVSLLAQLNTDCDLPTNSKLVVGSQVPDLSQATEADFKGAPSLYMINITILALSNALVDFGGASSFNSQINDFTASILQLNTDFSISLESIIYRVQLANLGLGASDS